MKLAISWIGLLIVWLALFVFTTCVSAVLLSSRTARPETFATLTVSSNALPHPIEMKNPWGDSDLDRLCAATNVLKYALMYKKAPAMASDDATVSRALLS